MIVGSIYLGKKARKAYRKHQAEKVAKQLTNPIDIVDPSDELHIKAPPTSPSDVGLSPSSTYSDDCQGSVLSSAPSSDRRGAGSQLASRPSSTTERSPEFARFNARDPDRMLPNQPPSYDSVVNSPQTSYTPMTAHGPFDNAHAQFLQGYQAHPPTHDGCPTCIAMMHHHQYHQAHLHSPPAVFGHASWDGARTAELASPEPPAISELPAQTVHEQISSTKELPGRAEMADTSKTAELPAELPADLSRLNIGAAKSQDGSRETSTANSAPAELPSETTDSEPEEEVLATESIDFKIDRSGDWKPADHTRI